MSLVIPHQDGFERHVIGATSLNAPLGGYELGERDLRGLKIFVPSDERTVCRLR